MKVNDVLRKGEVLVRILNTKDDLCLCINCNTESMPAWMPANSLEDYTPEAARVGRYEHDGKAEAVGS